MHHGFKNTDKNQEFVIFRQARPDETLELFVEGYKVWSRNRTFEQYCSDNSKEDAYGTRYVLEKDGQIVSSLILLKLNNFQDMNVYGIGSVLTSKGHEGNGFASVLLKKSIDTVSDDALIFLYSDIRPEFYSRFGFKALPSKLQHKECSTCMLRCKDEIWDDLINEHGVRVPSYF